MSSPQPSGDFKLLHRVIRFVFRVAAKSFFSEVRVIASENVPRDGPIIVAATHHNMIIDPVILSIAFPYERILNYWAKGGLFEIHPLVSWLLYSSGNIPVDRKSKDRKKLFAGTLEALAQGSAVAIFPEGTSYTEPKIMQVKDGAAWAALEYTKHAQENGIQGKPLVIVPAAIVYTNKSKYRSSVIMESVLFLSSTPLTAFRFGKPITMDAFKEEFCSSSDGAPRAAVKRLTKAIETSLTERTINAPDWDTLYVARMARDILWSDDKSPVSLDEFTAVSQTLVDLFSPENSALTRNFTSTKRALLRYYSLLQYTHLSHSTLSSIPLPRSLDPSSSVPLPSRLYTLLILIRDTTTALVNLPFFLLPLLFHLPVYFISRYGAHLVRDEEETQAQNKLVFGLLYLLFLYPTLFLSLWSLFLFTPVGIVAGLAGVYILWMHHTRMVDRYYRRFKSVVAAWRVLVGVWAPKAWEFGGSTVEELYGKPRIPTTTVNPWLNASAKKEPANESDSSSSSGGVPVLLHTPHISTAMEPPPVYPTSPSPSPSSSLTNQSSGESSNKKHNPYRRPPSRRIMRHVLRSRVEAVRALATFFEELELLSFGSAEGAMEEIRSSLHLAQIQKGSFGTGYREPKEVIGFLKQRGAVVPALTTSRTRVKDDGAEGDATDWGAITTADEGGHD